MPSAPVDDWVDIGTAAAPPAVAPAPAVPKGDSEITDWVDIGTPSGKPKLKPKTPTREEITKAQGYSDELSPIEQFGNIITLGGVRLAKRGVNRMFDEPDIEGKAGGARDVLHGYFQAGGPAAGMGALRTIGAAPTIMRGVLLAAKPYLVGTASGFVVDRLLNLLQAGPEVSALGGEVAGLGTAMLSGAGQAREVKPRLRAKGANVPWWKEAALTSTSLLPTPMRQAFRMIIKMIPDATEVEPTPHQRGMDPRARIPPPAPGKTPPPEPTTLQRGMDPSKRVQPPLPRKAAEVEPEPSVLQRGMDPSKRGRPPLPKKAAEPKPEPSVLQRGMDPRARLPLPARKQVQTEETGEGGAGGGAETGREAPPQEAPPQKPPLPKKQMETGAGAGEGQGSARSGVLDDSGRAKTNVLAMRFNNLGISEEDVMNMELPKFHEHIVAEGKEQVKKGFLKIPYQPYRVSKGAASRPDNILKLDIVDAMRAQQQGKLWYGQGDWRE
jgi:hypothetical protein